MFNNRPLTKGKMPEDSSSRLLTSRPIGTASIRNVLPMPMTSSGRQTQTAWMNRSIQDIGYWQSVLKQKYLQIQNEKLRLEKEIQERFEKEKDLEEQLEQKAEILSEDVKEKQSLLADLNLILDQLHQHSDLSQLDNQIKTQQEKNDNDSRLVALTKAKQNKEKEISELEKQIYKGREKINQTVYKLSAQQKIEYEKWNKENEENQKKIAQKKDQLSDLEQQLVTKEKEVSKDPKKQQIYQLMKKKKDLQVQYNELEKTSSQQLEEEEEKEKLLKQMKQDNLEVGIMEKKLNELQQQQASLQDQLSKLDQFLHQNEQVKLRNLKELEKKDVEIREFLKTFDEKHQTLQLAKENSEKTIRGYQMKLNDFEQNSANQLSAELQSKWQVESEDKMKQGISEMEKQLKEKEIFDQQYSQLEAMKAQTVQLKKEQTVKIKEIQEKKSLLQQKVRIKIQEYEEIQKKLSENETFKQLSALEQKLQQVEAAHFHLKEQLANQRAESDEQKPKHELLKLVNEYNSQLQKSLSGPIKS